MKKEIRRELKELGVSTVYLFGSRASQRQSRLSDVDFGVVLKKPALRETHDLRMTGCTDCSWRYIPLRNWI